MVECLNTRERSKTRFACHKEIMIINSDSLSIIDISMPISEAMPVYKGKKEKKPKHIIESDYSSGKVYESRIDMNLHTGTHLDQSLHMMEGGDTIDQLKLEKVVTACRVIDLTFVKDKISKEDLMNKEIKQGDFILMKTRNSHEDILEGDFVYLDESGAEYLKGLKIKGVGIDSLGIERSQPDHKTHILLLEDGIPILEGLRLKGVKEGEYFLIAAPIHIVGAEAAPVRAFLII